MSCLVSRLDPRPTSYRVVVGEKNLAQGKIEIKKRQDKESALVNPDAVVEWVRNQPSLSS